MKRTLTLLLIAVSFLAYSCFNTPVVEIPDEVVGLAPVYSVDDWREIRLLPPRNVERLGKIYYKDGFIFAGEIGHGIHIINNADPSQPVKTAFIQIRGNSDIAVKGAVLYANSLTDMVVLDISNPDTLLVVQRLENVFPQNSGAEFPVGFCGFFECPDPSLGPVIAWEEKLLKKPQCWH
jgi:hypothetical protein